LAIRNNCPAAEGRDTDLDVARELIRDPAAYAAALLPPFRGDDQASATTGQRATQ
jgi:carboxyl-terminal processing protease